MKRKKPKGHSQRAKGREILAEKKKKVERQTINGIAPERGLWVFNPESRKVVGRIEMVLRSGVVVIHDYLGTRVEIEQTKIQENGYVYGEPPSGRGWVFLPNKNADSKDYVAKLLERDTNTDKPKTKKQKVVSVSPCLCGCGTECKSRFIVGHDAKFKSKLRKAEKPLKLTQPQFDYLKSSTWMTDELWSNVNKRIQK